MEPLADGTIGTLKLLGDFTLVLALAVGGIIIVVALVKGMAAHRLEQPA